MPVFVEVEVDARDLADQTAARIAAVPLMPLHKQIGEYLYDTTQERFKREEAPDGSKWKSLKESTLARSFAKLKRKAPYKRVGRGARSGGGKLVATSAFARFKAQRKILQELGMKGGLRGSLAYEASEEAVRLGTNKVYGRAHQFGLGKRSSIESQRRFGSLPARPFLGVSDEDQVQIGRMVRSYLGRAQEGR